MKHDFAEFLDGREIFVTMTVHNHNKRVDSIFGRRQMNMYNLNCYHLIFIFSLFMKWKVLQHHALPEHCNKMR